MTAKIAKKRRRRPSRLQPLRWRLEAAIYFTLEWFLRRLSLRQTWKFGRLLGGLGWYLLPARRISVLRNLRLILTDNPPREGFARAAREVFRRSGANLLCSLRAPTLQPGEADSHFSLANREILEAALPSPSGIILLIPHMGNWELLTQLTWLIPAEIPRGGHYRPLNNPIIDRHVRQSRERLGTRLFSKRLSLHELSSFLRQPGILAVLGDQRTGKAGDLLPFFGRLTSCSPLASLLSRRTGAKIVVASIATTAPAHWTITFELLPDPASSADTVAALERAILRSPYDGFWFQDRWKVEKNPFLVSGKPQTASPPSSKPRRVLVWLPQPSTRPPQLPPASPDDLTLEFALPPEAPPPAWLPPGAITHPIPTPLGHALEHIDASQLLPLDFIVCPDPPGEELRRAARAASLPLWSPP